MRAMALAMGLAFGLALGAPMQARAEAQIPQFQDLVHAWNSMDSWCRGAGGLDIGPSAAACAARADIEDRLAAIGWCHDMPGSHTFWHPCSHQPLQSVKQ